MHFSCIWIRVIYVKPYFIKTGDTQIEPDIARDCDAPIDAMSTAEFSLFHYVCLADVTCHYLRAPSSIERK